MNDQPIALAEPPRPGEAVDAYRIEKELGGGGMGYVYKAVGPDGAAVAIKMVKADLAFDGTFRKRFDREARIAQDLKHPNVVPVLDKGEHGGIPYMVQRFVGGGSLQEHLEQRKTLDVETVVRVCTHVAAGLDALHDYARQVEARLVHRDVKPGNILLDERGIAYITDFGLAKDSRGSVLTAHGYVLGTPDYMAPEQIRSEDVGVATDVYALGCVMYECLLGAPPFADRPAMRLLWAHLQDPPPNRFAERGDVSPEFGAWILRALEKDAAQRPQSAGELARGLQQAAGVIVEPAPEA
jgi:serine/threonine-protein kinase